MKILLENLGEASSQPSPTQSTQEAVRVRKDVSSGPDHLKGINQWRFLLWLWRKVSVNSVFIFSVFLVPSIRRYELVGYCFIYCRKLAGAGAGGAWSSQGRRYAHCLLQGEGPVIVACMLRVCPLLVKAEFAEFWGHWGGILWVKKQTRRAA